MPENAFNKIKTFIEKEFDKNDLYISNNKNNK